MKSRPCRCEIVDLAAIAAHMRVQRFTPQQWKQRGLLPPVDFPDIEYPLWYTSTIVYQFINTPHSIEVGRLWYPKDARDVLTDEELADLVERYEPAPAEDIPVLRFSSAA
jgi:hypothetical protein